MSITIWILIAIIFFILELITTTFFLMWFGVGAIVAIILNLLGFDNNIQIIAFLIVSIVFILSSRKFAKQVTKPASRKPNQERVIGKIAIVDSKFSNSMEGVVKVNGEEWTAYLGEDIEVGDKVRIVGIESIKLIVEKIK